MKPTATQSGGSGETRWKSMIPLALAPPTAEPTCDEPMKTSRMN